MLYYVGQCFENGIDYFGNDIQSIAVNTAEECQEACFAEPECNVWTFSLSSGTCWMKTTKGTDIRINTLRISGPKTCPRKLINKRIAA